MLKYRRTIITGHWQGQLSIKVALAVDLGRRRAYVDHKSDAVDVVGLVINTSSTATRCCTTNLHKSKQWSSGFTVFYRLHAN